MHAHMHAHIHVHVHEDKHTSARAGSGGWTEEPGQFTSSGSGARSTWAGVNSLHERSVAFVRK
jgi:hypothetical protein